MHTIAHHGRETAYRLDDRTSTGPALVCIHGAGATHACWRGQFRLGGAYRIAAVDLSGHGESDDIHAVPGWETLDAYAADAAAVIEATGARIVIGHSMGGAIAIHLATEYNVTLDGIIVIGTGPRLPVHDHILHLAEHDFEALITFLHGPDRLFYDADPATIEASKTAMHSCGGDVTSRDFLTCNAVDLHEHLVQLDVPLAAICGEHDRMTPIEVHERLVSRIDHATLEIIPDAGHVAMLERPTQVNETISQFLEDVTERSARER